MDLAEREEVIERLAGGFTEVKLRATQGDEGYSGQVKRGNFRPGYGDRRKNDSPTPSTNRDKSRNQGSRPGNWYRGVPRVTRSRDTDHRAVSFSKGRQDFRKQSQGLSPQKAEENGKSFFECGKNCLELKTCFECGKRGQEERMSENKDPRFAKRYSSQSRAPGAGCSKVHSSYILPRIFAVSAVCSSRGFNVVEFWLGGSRVHALIDSGSAISLVKKDMSGAQIKQLKFKLSDIQGKRIQLYGQPSSR